MDVKSKYLKYNRIAVIISFVLGSVVAISLFEGIKIDCIFGGIISFMGIFVLVLDYKKYESINKMLGFLKVSGDNWLGYDGLWHEGYKEISKKRVEEYYNNRGKDFGHTFGRTTQSITLLWVLLGLGGLTGQIETIGVYWPYYFWCTVWMIYIIKSKIISG